MWGFCKNKCVKWKKQILDMQNGKIYAQADVIALTNYTSKIQGNWILHSEVSEFGFYTLKFRDIWILHSDVLEFEFQPLYFRCVWILLPKILRCLNFTS